MNLSLDTKSKSEQIVAFVSESIQTGKWVPGDLIPSINEMALRFQVARKTVVRSYERLKKAGLIESRAKKGFFVISKKPNEKQKILLIIHSFDGHWETLYNSFREKVAKDCDIEIYFHHYNINLLELIINRNMADFDQLIISSFNHPRIRNVIGRIPAYKVLIISRNDRLGGAYNYIVQDFAKGTFDALLQAKNKLNSYKSIVLCYPEKEGHSDTLKQGFIRYCETYGLVHEVVNDPAALEIKRGNCYLVINDNHLIHLLNVCKNKGWSLGRDLGILSYNETPLKQVIRDGISVISCNFLLMAEEMARFVKERKTIKTTIPIEFIERNSI